MNAVLLNDTSIGNHYGCKLVVEAINNACAIAGINIVHSVKLGEDWHLAEHIAQIKSADMVIVNGEGSVHHSKQAALNLTSCAGFCRIEGIPCFLIKSVYQQNNAEMDAYTKIFDKIFVRESKSQNELAGRRITSEVVPDAIFSLTGLFNTNLNERHGMLFTDGVSNEVANRLYLFSKKKPNASFITLMAHLDKKLCRQRRFRICGVKTVPLS